ncbi:radical SAM protein [Desulfobacterales bacterium HSG16]|nr:radical SAM protein [Desulfobacterales bacterium HSG16]
MQYLLVVPRIVNKLGDWYWFPTGIGYISSCLKSAGFDIQVLNLNHREGTIYDILKQHISTYNNNVVLTGGLTGQYGAIRNVVESVKRINPIVTTVVGGGIVTSAPEHGMQALEYADYGVIGEGEILCCQLCTALENGSNISEIPGIVYKDKLDYIVTNGRVPQVDIDNLPFPDYHAMGLEKQLDAVPNFVGMCEEGTVSIITSRSCPFKCTFCFHPSGQTYRQRSLDNVFAEIDFLLDKFQVSYLSIQDELFGCHRKRLEEFCQRIKPYQIKWWAQFRVTDISKDIVAMLKDANCGTISLGVESADNTILNSLKKKITIEQSEKALKLIHQSGIGIQANLIFGDRAETIETAKKTLEWWKQYKHYQLQLSMIVTYPGTQLYEYARSKGMISDPVSFIRQSCPLLKLSSMTDSDYAWLLGQLFSLPRELQETPGGCKIININWHTAHITLEGLCVSCGSQNTWKNVRLFITSSLICSECGRRHTAPVVDEVVVRVVERVYELIQQYGDVVFWGINSYFYDFTKHFTEKIDNDVTKHIHYVDDSTVRQGVELSSSQIESPAVIEQQNIGCVIIAVVQHFTSLKNTIHDEFPEVSSILSIVDLLSTAGD